MPVLKSTRLLDQLKEQIRYLHCSLRTEEAYVFWVKEFIFFHGKRHPRDMGQVEVEAFFAYLAVQRKVSVRTHRQALSALLFLHQKVFGAALPQRSRGQAETGVRSFIIVSSIQTNSIVVVYLRACHRDR